MVHDCSITERWLVVDYPPVTFDLDAAMGGRRFPNGLNDAHQARIGLVPLGGRGHDVRWFDVSPCYVFHPLNAYDDGDRVVLDVVRHPKMFATNTDGPDEGPPMPWRWTIDTARGAVSEAQLSYQPLEFPRVAARVIGRTPGTGYATAMGLYSRGYFCSGAPSRIPASRPTPTLTTCPGHSRRAGV